MDLLEDLNMLLLDFNYVMIYVIHKMLVLIKYSLNYMKIVISNALLRSIIIAFNHSSDIDFKDLMNLYKKCTATPYTFLVTDTTLASDNSSRFRKNLLKRT